MAQVAKQAQVLTSNPVLPKKLTIKYSVRKNEAPVRNCWSRENVSTNI
jgi:hypothetical protein